MVAEKKKEGEIKAIIDMHANIETSVKVEYSGSGPFDVKVEVHQGSILSLLLFALVMDEVTEDIREEVVNEMSLAEPGGLPPQLKSHQ